MPSLYLIDLRLPLTPWTLSIHRPGAHQRGFWMDRLDSRCTVVGLGRVQLYVERRGFGPLLAYFR